MNKFQHDSEVLKEGQQVITACAFIYHNFDNVLKVFIPKRADTKKFLPGIYELPGGHIDFGENIEHGLKREILEEFGVEIKIGDPFAAFTYINQIKKSHAVEIVYFAQFTGPIENIKINPEDHSQYIWIAENEIDTIISNNKNTEDQEIKVILKGFENLRKLL